LLSPNAGTGGNIFFEYLVYHVNLCHYPFTTYGKGSPNEMKTASFPKDYGINPQGFCPQRPFIPFPFGIFIFVSAPSTLSGRMENNVHETPDLSCRFIVSSNH